MKIVGPDRYKLTFDANRFTVLCPKGTPKFSGLATSKRPKLYIVSVDGNPIYVGITRQSTRNRIRMGFSATGDSGYHGYAWRHKYTQAILDVWCHEDAPAKNAERDMETIEAEVVFLARLAGQWPAGQTEIHFHPSSQEHRAIASSIWKYVTTSARS
jgi:hypothetical protein